MAFKIILITHQQPLFHPDWSQRQAFPDKYNILFQLTQEIIPKTIKASLTDIVDNHN